MLRKILDGSTSKEIQGTTHPYLTRQGPAAFSKVPQNLLALKNPRLTPQEPHRYQPLTTFSTHSTLHPIFKSLEDKQPVKLPEEI